MKIALFFVLVFSALEAETAVIFTLHKTPKVDWATAKSNCEDLGERLAVLDTEEKQNTLESQVPPASTQQTGEPWIGFSDVGNNDTYFWINGQNVDNGYKNWKTHQPDGNGRCGYLSTQREWDVWSCGDIDSYVCEWNECEAGYFKKPGPPARCEMCSGNTIKTSVGDATDCDADPPCDGTTNVPNAGHTACDCLAAYYTNETGTCLSCFDILFGHDAENITDGRIDTCVTIPTPDGAFLPYKLGVNGNCSHGNMLDFNVTVTSTSDCDTVRSMILVDRDSHCDSRYRSPCKVVSSYTAAGQSVCSLNCKCAESADQCLIYVFSGLINSNVELCDIKMST